MEILALLLGSDVAFSFGPVNTRRRYTVKLWFDFMLLTKILDLLSRSLYAVLDFRARLLSPMLFAETLFRCGFMIRRACTF